MAKLNLDAWKRLNPLDYVLDWIQNGVKFPFHSEPTAVHLDNHVNGPKQEQFIDQEIPRLLEIGAICQCYGWTPKCVLPLKTVPK